MYIKLQGVSFLRKLMKIRLVHYLYMYIHMTYTVYVSTSPV
jgi:hypothetical protein